MSRRTEDEILLSPGRVIDTLANHIASLRSKLGNAAKHGIGGALTGRKRLMHERVSELERVASDFGYEIRRRIEDRVSELLKD